MVFIKKRALSNLPKFDIVEGFTWSVKTSDDEGKAKLKSLLKQKLLDGAEILLAVEDSNVVGFAIILNWQALPDAKFLDSIEVARPYRNKGIGSTIMHRIFEEWDTLIALEPLSEPHYEEKLIKFYQRFGFKTITSDLITPVIMTRIPRNNEKLKEWIEYINKRIDEYSYQTYQIQPILHIWGRRYAPWLKFTGDVYPTLLQEMKKCIEEQENL